MNIFLEQANIGRPTKFKENYEITCPLRENVGLNEEMVNVLDVWKYWAITSKDIRVDCRVVAAGVYKLLITKINRLTEKRQLKSKLKENYGEFQKRYNDFFTEYNKEGGIRKGRNDECHEYSDLS